jgi:hypothetical protein
VWIAAIVSCMVAYAVVVNSPDAALSVHRAGGLLFISAPILSLSLSLVWLRRDGAGEVRSWHGGKVVLLWSLLVLTYAFLSWFVRVVVICPASVVMCVPNRNDELGTVLYIWIPALFTVAAITWAWLSSREVQSVR